MGEAKTIPRKTRIQAQNEELILKAALEVFSAYGFRGATVDQIATSCGLSKPNLLYYFRRKEDIYVAVLEHTLHDWLEPLRSLDPAGEPIDEITRYIRTKIRLSRDNPKASRLFANEILHGATAIGAYLKGPLKELVDEKAAIIRGWIADGPAQRGRPPPPDLRHLGDDPALRRFRTAGECRHRQPAGPDGDGRGGADAAVRRGAEAAVVPPSSSPASAEKSPVAARNG